MSNQTNALFKELTPEEANQIKGGFYLSSPARQVLGLISGIRRNGGSSLGLNALSGRSITFSGGVQRLPLRLIFRRR